MKKYLVVAIITLLFSSFASAANIDRLSCIPAPLGTDVSLNLLIDKENKTGAWIERSPQDKWDQVPQYYSANHQDSTSSNFKEIFSRLKKIKNNPNAEFTHLESFFLNKEKKIDGVFLFFINWSSLDQHWLELVSLILIPDANGDLEIKMVNDFSCQVRSIPRWQSESELNLENTFAVGQQINTVWNWKHDTREEIDPANNVADIPAAKQKTLELLQKVDANLAISKELMSKDPDWKKLSAALYDEAKSFSEELSTLAKDSKSVFDESVAKKVEELLLRIYKLHYNMPVEVFKLQNTN